MCSAERRASRKPLLQTESLHQQSWESISMNRSVGFLTVSGVVLAARLFGQGNPTYIQFSPSPVKGALYKPDSGPAPHVAVVIIHRTANFLGSPASREL